MAGVKYVVEYGDRLSALSDLSADGVTYTQSLLEADSELNEVAIVRGGNTPMLYDLSSIDEFRTDEAKVPANTFLIVDTTGATYNRVIEDDRKGFKREVIGIIPVVTTAANALYAQNYISTKELSDIHKFESIGGSRFFALKATDRCGCPISIDGNEMSTLGLSATDLTKLIGCDSYYSNISSINVNVLTTDVGI